MIFKRLAAHTVLLAALVAAGVAQARLQAQDAQAAPAAPAAASTPAAPASSAEPAAAATPAAGAEPWWMPKPEPGKAMVVIFRESRFVGGGAAMQFYLDEGTKLTKLKNGRVMHFYLEPGDHRLYSDKKKARDARILGVEAGEVHFFEARWEMGAWTASIDLVPVDREEAIQRISQFKHPAS